VVRWLSLLAMGRCSMSNTPENQKAEAMIEAMREMGNLEVKIFTATLIGMLQEKFNPEEFASAISEAKAAMGYQQPGGTA
jgi:hypothetical protein